MAKVSKIEVRTIHFIEEYKRLKDLGKMPALERLAEIMGIKSKSSISEILGKRQNIQPASWDLFKKHFKIGIKQNSDISESSGNTEINVDLAKELLIMKRKLIRAEATINILTVTMAEFISASKKKSIATISAELSKAISSEEDVIFSDWGKK